MLKAHFCVGYRAGRGYFCMGGRDIFEDIYAIKGFASPVATVMISAGFGSKFCHCWLVILLWFATIFLRFSLSRTITRAKPPPSLRIRAKVYNARSGLQGSVASGTIFQRL